MTTPKLFWLFSLAVLLFQGALAYPQLPDQMVTHMSLEGEPDGFGSKSGFYLSFGLAVLLINIMPPLLSILLKKLPESLINLPNKEYWFADATRKAKAVDIMVGMLAATMGMVNVMFILIFQQMADLSIGNAPSIPTWLIWCIIPILILFPPVYLFRSFRVPEN